MKHCKKCGIEHGQQTPGCPSCYMREDYYKRPGKAEKRKTASAAYYQATKGDPVKMEQRTRWLREHPEEVREMQNRSTAKYRRKLRDMVDAAKARPCVVCGNSYPPQAMDLHHRDPATKSFNICTFVSRSGAAEQGQSRASALEAEIAKCDVLCAVCHRLHHAA